MKERGVQPLGKTLSGMFSDISRHETEEKELGRNYELFLKKNEQAFTCVSQLIRKHGKQEEYVVRLAEGKPWFSDRKTTPPAKIGKNDKTVEIRAVENWIPKDSPPSIHTFSILAKMADSSSAIERRLFLITSSGTTNWLNQQATIEHMDIALQLLSRIKKQSLRKKKAKTVIHHRLPYSL